MGEEKKATAAPAAMRAIIIKAAEREPGALPDPFTTFYTTGQVAEPPLPFANLKIIVEQSNILPQCIEAMARNVGGYGYELKCRVPDDEKEAMAVGIREEWDKLDSFFRYAVTDRSFTRLRYDTRCDLEIYGNAWWEVLRTRDNEIVGFAYLPAATMRCGAEAARVQVKARRMEADTWDYRDDEDWRVFRPHAQIVGATTVWFKEFGDPRTLARETGNVLSAEDDPAVRAGDKDAREVIHFTIGPKSGIYGNPRWIGNLLSAAGSRSAEEVNWLTFEDQGLGRFMVLVSGGSLTEQVVTNLKEFVKAKKEAGTEDFHKGIIIEGVSAQTQGAIDGTAAPVKIEVKELGTISDALFKDYDRDNREKLRSAFRLPALYVGLTNDYTRATAKEGREYAEEQVFGPERSDEDEFFTRMILPALDAVYHEFVTKGAAVTSDDDRVTLWGKASTAGMPLKHVILGLAEVLNVKIDAEELEAEDWAQKPLALGRAGTGESMFGFGGNTGATNPDGSPQLAKVAKVLRDLQAVLKRGKDGKPRNWFARMLDR